MPCQLPAVYYLLFAIRGATPKRNFHFYYSRRIPKFTHSPHISWLAHEHRSGYSDWSGNRDLRCEGRRKTLIASEFSPEMTDFPVYISGVTLSFFGTLDAYFSHRHQVVAP
jgi:hypothetical protein